MAEAAARERRSSSTALVIAVLACALLAWAIHAASGEDGGPTRADRVDLSSLREATTRITTKGAPQDPRPMAEPSGVIVHPRRTVAVHASPGGEAFAKLGPDQFGDTWVPVIGKRPGWVRVLLPSRPNGSTGWLRTGPLERARSSHRIRVHLASRTLELFDDGSLVGTWPVAVGAPDTPTPVGRTFLLGQLTDPDQSFSPVIIPLGTHSATLDSYGGGPGTVAVHGWTDPSVFGLAVSHGCIRVPADALDLIRTVPLGTPVLIDDA
jgi:hypothetical protein